MTEPVDPDGDVILPADTELDSALSISKRHNTAPLSEAEKLVVMHLVDTGQTVKEIAKVLGRHVETVSKYIKRYKIEAEGESRLDLYLDLHLAAAKIAATKGNSRPMEFMLDRYGIVPAARVQAPQSDSKAINIAVGLNLPGSVQTVPKAELAVLDVPTSTSNDEG